MTVMSNEEREFEAQRPRLFALAYRLLGSASEAEDAVQDTFLRWSAADRTMIVTPAAWLTTVLTNLCLTRLTSARARRDDYAGLWLPEPVLTDSGQALDPLETAQQRESVSMAVLVLLERLTPAQRAVFVLREAFSYSHRDIAAILDVTEANSQQLYRRARQHLGEAGERKPRYEASREQWHRIVDGFLDAAKTGDLATLERMLADDVASWADGGGKAPAARRPIRGAARVARYLCGLARRIDESAGIAMTKAEVNGQPAVMCTYSDHLVMVMVLALAEGRVRDVRVVVNPDKLAYLAKQMSLSVIRVPLMDFLSL